MYYIFVILKLQTDLMIFMCKLITNATATKNKKQQKWDEKMDFNLVGLNNEIIVNSYIFNIWNIKHA